MGGYAFSSLFIELDLAYPVIVALYYPRNKKRRLITFPNEPLSNPT
jgi:hypothetical protein